MKSIETHARAFSRLISDGISGVNTTGSQILIIAQTLKALDFLIKKSVLTTVVFYTHKKTLEGRAFIGSTNCFP